MNHTNNNPALIERNRTIAQDRLQGKTYREIAAKHDIAISGVSRILNDAEIRDIVSTGIKEQAKLIPIAIDNYSQLLASDNEKIRLEATRDIVKNTGISNDSTRNPIILQYTALNVGQIVDSKLQEAFSQQFSGLGDDIQDAEYEEYNE